MCIIFKFKCYHEQPGEPLLNFNGNYANASEYYAGAFSKANQCWYVFPSETILIWRAWP